MATHIELPRGLFFVVLVIATLAVSGVLMAVYLPRATIELSPATYTRDAEQDILLSSATNDPDFVSFTLPARVVEARVIEEELVRRSGGESRPDFAKGVVRLINDQDEEQPLLPQTHLRHEATGVFFLTDAAVRIPPQGSLEVGVTAKEEGASGNVPAGKFVVDKLPASLQSVVYAESTTAFSGGEVFDTPLTQDEIDAARERLLASARERVRGELTAVAGGAAPRDDLVDVTVAEEAVSVPAGSLASNFTLRLVLEARGFVVDEADLLSLTLLSLRSSSSADEELVTYNPESFAVDLQRADFERGEARVQGRLTGTFTPKTPPSIFSPEKLSGLTSAEVSEYFKQFDSIGNVNVSLWPFWVSTVPSRTNAVEIILRQTSSQ